MGLRKRNQFPSLVDLSCARELEHCHGGTDCDIGGHHLSIFHKSEILAMNSFPVQDMTKRRSKSEEIFSAWHLEVSLGVWCSSLWLRMSVQWTTAFALCVSCLLVGCSYSLFLVEDVFLSSTHTSMLAWIRECMRPHCGTHVRQKSTHLLKFRF